MKRGFRGRTASSARLLPLLLLAGVVAVGCAPRAVPSTAPATPTAAASTAEVSPTPIPTGQASATPQGSELPIESEAPPPAELVIRATSCSDTCGPTAGTTILGDGRIIWENAVGQVRESHLTDAALEQVRREIGELEALRVSAEFSASPRPGAQPTPHGVAVHQFEIGSEPDRIVVSTIDPGSLADEASLWIIPQEAFELTAFAHRLGDPAAWLGEAAFSEAVRPFVPEGYLVTIVPFPEIGVTGSNVDVDDVDWPFAGPIEAAGAPMLSDDGESIDRCLLIDRASGAALLAAEAAAGAVRSLEPWESVVVYDWRRGSGWVDVRLLPLLPHQAGSCVEIAAEVP
ncbi:MAG TPA: hypothetical protein VM451_00400 [Candidatus Limnocylindria bacterium]|nr:hypothetical protein [Candidatus Limnocylindria bacterium]